MSIKTILVAAAAVGIAAPAFAQEVRVTAEQCLEAGGEVIQATNVCRIVDEDELAGLLENDGLGGGLGGGGAIAAGFLIVLAGCWSGESLLKY